MAYNPGVSFFISFHELDPSRGSQCIFFTKKGARCRSRCHKSDNRDAGLLYHSLITSQPEALNLDQLRKYVLYNCCRKGRAQHQDRIEDVGLLMPLARRWLDEIQAREATRSKKSTSIPAPSFSSYTCATPVTTAAVNTMTPSSQAASLSIQKRHDSTSIGPGSALFESVESPFQHQFNLLSPSTVSESMFPKFGAGASTCQLGSLTTSATPVYTSQSINTQPRYNLRPREADVSLNSASAELASSTSVFNETLSEFRPHIAHPSPSDSVACKILKPLRGRDLETGMLYIFDRKSSPGHVKIGWTARSVWGRLEDWSRCGYAPRLLFERGPVQHAQRAELLTHYELMKEWRRERMCKASWCRKSHQEWFEVSKEQAQQVLGGWVDFLTRATPYDSDGMLKDQWRKVVENMDREGGLITAKKLLYHYEQTLVGDATLVSGIEAVASTSNELKIEPLETPTGALVCLESPQIEDRQVFEEAPTFKTEALAQEILSDKGPPLKVEQHQPSSSLYKTDALPETKVVPQAKPRPAAESLFTLQIPSNIRSLLTPELLMKRQPPLESLASMESSPFNIPGTRFLFKTELQLEFEGLSKSGPASQAEVQFDSASLPNKESLLETEPLPESQVLNEGVSATLETAPVKNELTPEQNPLNPSPICRPPIFSQDILSTADTHASLSTPKTFGQDSLDSPATEVSLNVHEQEETSAFSVSAGQHQQAAEREGQEEPENGLPKCESQPSEATTKLHSQDESNTAEQDPDWSVDGYDAEDTLVEEDRSLSTVEADALKIVEEISNDILAGNALGETSSASDGIKMLETEAPPAVEVSALA